MAAGLAVFVAVAELDEALARPITRLAAAAADPASDLRVPISEGLPACSGVARTTRWQGGYPVLADQPNIGSPKCENDHPEGRSFSHVTGVRRCQPSSSPSTERRRLGALPLSTGAWLSPPVESASSCWLK